MSNPSPPALAYSSRPRPTAVASGSARAAPDSVDSMRAYFREIGAVKPMTPEQEFAAGVEIAALRAACWRALLGHPPLVDRVCALVGQAVPAQATRDADRGALASALAAIDLDGVLADRALADIEALAGACDAATVSPADRAAVLAHLARVRAAHRALSVAKTAFVTANLRLVVTIARRFHPCRLPLLDLIQEGNLGLMKAVHRFDPHKGFRFSSYASWWIRQAIGRSIAEKVRTVRLPVHMVVASNKVRRIVGAFELRHGRKPDDAELAQLTGVTPGVLRRMHDVAEDTVSTAQPLTGTGLTVLDVVADTRAPEAADVIDRRLLVSSLHESFAALSPIEADVLRKRTGMDDDRERTLREIGEGYALSRERIRQVQEQAVEKLRGEFARRRLV